MTAAYSIDFHKKIVELYERGNTSYFKVATNFGISVISAKRYVKQYRENGDLSPQKGNQGRPAKIDDNGYKFIQNVVRKHPTITLGELSELYYKEKKINAGRSVLSRVCKKLDLRRKKLSRYAAERDRDDVKKNGKNILK